MQNIAYDNFGEEESESWMMNPSKNSISRIIDHQPHQKGALKSEIICIDSQFH